MHVLVLGGTGASGLAFVREALNADHRLTIYARNPSKFPSEVSSHPNVTIVKGGFDDMAAFKQALDKGADHLISFAGPAGPWPPAKGHDLEKFYQSFCSVIAEQGSIKRVMILATASYQVPEDRPGLVWDFGIMLIKLFFGTAYSEINGMSKAVASLPRDRIDWTIFRVPILTNSDKKEVQADMLGGPKDQMTLSRGGMAVWTLHELEAKKWVGKAPAISNPGWM